MTKLTTYTNRKIIPNEYPMVSYRTKEYDLLVKYNKISVSQEDSIIILKWMANSCQPKYWRKMNLKINFRNCQRAWGGKRRGIPFVTIPHSNKVIGVLVHEFTHAHNYFFKSGRNHNDGFILTQDKFIRKFHTTKAREIASIKEKYI